MNTIYPDLLPTSSLIMKIPNQNLLQLIDYLLSAHDCETMQQILENLLTPSELIEISKRLQIIELLKQGISQREIAKQLGVGIATVTRGSRVLKYDSPIGLK